MKKRRGCCTGPYFKAAIGVLIASGGGGGGGGGVAQGLGGGGRGAEQRLSMKYQSRHLVEERLVSVWSLGCGQWRGGFLRLPRFGNW